METNSHISCLEEQLKEYYGRVVWTHKTHEKQADIYTLYNNSLKWCQIIITALVTSGTIATIIRSETIVAILTGFLSAIHLIITTLTKNKDFGQIAQLHALTAIQIWDIRERLLSLLIDCKDSRVSVDEARIKRDKIHNQLLMVYEKAPRTSARAYKMATKGLKDSQEMFFTNEEIDDLLPSVLKSKQ
jgi:hypothetical protein